MAGQVDKPLLRLELPDSMCNCIDWINGGRLICGTSTGESFLDFLCFNSDEQVS